FATSRFPETRGALRHRHAGPLTRHCPLNLEEPVYAHRSKIAHGMVDTKPAFVYDGQHWSSAEIAPFLLRALLKSRLISSPEWTKKNIEGRIIAALAAYGLSGAD
ncbi:hypothetical protein ACWDTD_07760, partial [Gordonia sp. NPDC003425]